MSRTVILAGKHIFLYEISLNKILYWRGVHCAGTLSAMLNFVSEIYSVHLDMSFCALRMENKEITKWEMI